MRTFGILLFSISAICFADVPTEELLSSERIVNHDQSFSRFDIILNRYGFKRAKYEDVRDPTAHFERFVEWVYYTQNVYADSKNEILIGYNSKGIMEISTVLASAPLCDCPEYQANLKKRKQMDEALERLKQDSSTASQTIKRTLASTSR